MKLEEIKNKTNEAVSDVAAALESGQSDNFDAASQRDGPVPQLLLWKYHADRPTESSDMLLYLAGVNEHAVLRIAGSKR